MIFDRLAIGTGNWGKEYNGAKVSEDDQKRILDYCQCSGIDMIDTATAYEWDWTKVSSYFNVVVKVKSHDDVGYVRGTKPYCLMSHDNTMDSICCMYDGPWGVSCYEPSARRIGRISPDVIQVPYSLYDRRFEHYIETEDAEIHVRSIFLRGKIIQAGVEPWKCIAFCLMNPYIDRVIIGADSYEQFKENLRPFPRMDVMKKSNENLLDPRKWGKEEK